MQRSKSQTGWKSPLLLCWAIAVPLMAFGCTAYDRAHAVDLEELEPVHDQWYVLRDSEAGNRVGARHLVVRSDSRVLAIVERIALQQGSDTVAYRSEIRYARQDRLVLRSATVTTYLNGRPFMGGRASYRERTLRVTAALADAEGDLQEPLRHAQYRAPESGRVAFLPGLPYLLKEMRETGGVPDELSLVEFPADLDILVQLRPGVVEHGLAAEGSTNYTVRNPDSEELLARWTIDADGRVRNGMFFQTEFIPATRDEALGTAEVD